MQPLLFALPSLLFSALGAHRAGAQELTLEVGLQVPVRSAEEQQVLRATLRNRSQRPLEILLPEHLGLVPFPAWELRDESGKIVRPETPPFQSMWKLGLQGEVLKLAPGAEQSFDVETLVPPGRWTARCVLAQERAEVPWGLPNFREEMRPRPSLWTGRVESASFAFEVQAYRAPRLELALPERVAIGGPCRATGTLLWPSAAGPRPARLGFRVNLGSKARGYATAYCAWSGERWTYAHDPCVGALPPPDGERMKIELDLARVLFSRQKEYPTEQAKSSPEPRELVELGELLDSGWFYLELSGVDADGKVLFQCSASSSLEELSSATSSGLVVALRASELGPRHVEVALRNASGTPRRVPADLGIPRHLAFELRFAGAPQSTHWSVLHSGGLNGFPYSHADPPLLAVLPQSLSWAASMFEPAPNASTEVLLAPGSELIRTVDLRTLVHDPQHELDQALLVKPIWRNRRCGFAGSTSPALVTGFLIGAELALPALAR